MTKKIIKFISFFSFIFFFFSCENWMKSDDFFNKIDDEVFVANAEKISVYVRYANTTQGTTTPDRNATFKVEVPSSVSCVTNTAFGFHHWAAFSSSYFNTQGQNKTIIYNSGAGGYNDEILQHELGEDIVSFSDKFSNSTDVTIHTKRNDIVLVPVVAERPTISQQSPQVADTKVVRNTTLRYIFTKRMDLESFSLDNVRITSGPAVLTDQEIATNDITEIYIWEDPVTNTRSPVQSSTGKMIKFTPRSGFSLDSNQLITIYLMTGVKDEDGYKIESEQKPYFTTGTSVDSLAPRLDTLTAGIKEKIKTFIKIIRKANGVDVSKYDLESDDFKDYLKQRAQDNINIYIYALDLAGEGAIASSSTDEESVALYGIRAKLLYDADGNKVDSEDEKNNIAITQNAYIVGGNYIPHQIKEDYNTTNGFAFNYDLSSLPDGIIQLDLWAVDSAGNSGLDEKYYDTHDNGCLTLIIVKDTHSPDITTESKKVVSKSSDENAAPYGWYNKSSISTTTIVLADGKKIIDSGHSKLNSDEEDIEWIFSVGDNPADWHPTADDSSWKKIIKNNSPTPYVLDNITAQKEGAVGILMALKDDIGNISETVKLDNTVMYDSTKPEVGKLSWVDASGNEVLPISKLSNLSGNHYLKVPFTENLSGLRLLAIELDGANYTTDANKENMSFYYNNISTKVNHTIATHNGKTYAVLNPPINSQGFSSGVIFIGGLNLGTSAADGAKEFKVSLIDAALNDLTTPSSGKNTLVYDKTAPEVESVIINEFISDGSRKWLKNDAFTINGENRTPNKASITVTAIETTSGIETIKLSGVNLTANTKIYLGNSASGTPITCTVDESAGTITLPYNSTPVLRNSEKVIFTITGISFTKNIDNGNPNQIDVQLTDFAGNSKQKTNCDSIYIDSKSADAPSIVISDKGSAFSPNSFWEWLTTKNQYTDSDTVDITVTLTGNAAVDSGIKSLKFMNVKFDSGTTVTPNATISGSTITFNDILNVNETINIMGAKLIESNKFMDVTVSSTDLIGWSSAIGSNSIRHDDTKPKFMEKPQWISTIGGINSVTDKPNQSEAKVKQKLQIPYVETGAGIKVVKISGAYTSTVTAVYNGGILLDSATDYTLNDDYIVFTTPLVSDSGYIDIEGLNLANPVVGDSDYTVTVSLYDAAENNDVATENSATICVDTTPPALEKVVVPYVKRVQYYGDATGKWHYYFETSALKTDVILCITEKTSGIKTIEFTGNIKPTSSSTLKLNGAAVSTSEYTIDITASKGTITFKNPFVIRDDTRFELEVKDCAIISGENALAVQVADFAELSSSKVTAGTYREVSDTGAVTLEEEFAETMLSSETRSQFLNNVKLQDRGIGDTEFDLFAASENYANYKVINAEMTLPAMDSSYNPTRRIWLWNSDASFVASGSNSYNSKSNVTEIKVDGKTLTAGVDYEISADNKTVTFTKAFANTEAITLTFSNIELTGSDGEKSIKFVTYPSTPHIGASSGTKTITLDTVAPQTTGACSYSGQAVNYPRTVDSITPTYGIEIDGIPYFYTSGATRLFDIINRKTASTYNTVDDNDYSIKISTTATTAETIYADASAINTFKDGKTQIEVAAGTSLYSYIIYDKAGNCSEVKSFYLIKDESFNDTIISAPVYNPVSYPVFKQSKSYYIGKKVNISIEYSVSDKANTDSGITEWGITYSATGTPSTLNEYTSGNITFNLQDYIDDSELKTLYLYLKDNVGNEKRIPLKDGSNVVEWQNTSPPEFTPKLQVYGSGNHNNRYGNLATQPVGDIRYINFYNRTGTDYEISVQYTNNNCFYDEDGAVFRNSSEPTSDYTVRARLHWVSESASAPTANDIKTATSCVSDWFYSKNKSGTRNIALNFLKNSDDTDTDFAPSTKYKLYLLIENAAGDAVVKQVSIANSDGSEENVILCKDNTPPVIDPKTILSANTSGVYQKESAGNEFYFKGDTGSEYTFTINKSAITETESGVLYLKKGDAKLADNATTVTHKTTTAEDSFTLSAVDQTRNESTPVTINLYRDNTKPTISDFTVEETDGVHNDGADYYFNSNATTGKSIGIKFKVSDTRDGTKPGSGIKEVIPSEVTYDSSTEYYNLTIPLSDISTTKKIDIAATDNVGLTSELKEISIIPDGVGPTFDTGAIILSNTDSVFFDSGKGYFYKPGTSITFNVTTSSITDNDGGSGFDKLVYTISESDTTTGLSRNEITLSGTSFTISTSSSDNANKYIKIYAVDNVGNESATPISFTIIPDGAAPGIPNLSDVSADNFYPATIADWTVGGATKGFFKETAIVTFASAGDNDGSGIEGIYEWDTTTDKIGSKLTSDQKSVSATSTITVVAKDNVGNVSAPFTVTLTKDATVPNKPTLSTVTATEIYPKTVADWTVSGSTSGYFRGEAATVTFAATDNTGGCGIEGIYEWDTTTDKIGSKLTSDQKSVSATSTITVVSKDNLGNISDKFIVEIQQDNTKPSITSPTFAATPEKESIYKQDDAGGTSSTIYYKGDDNSRTGSLTFTLSDTGSNLKDSGKFFMSDSNSVSAYATETLYSSLSLASTTLTGTKYFYTVDNVGNVSEPYAIAFVNDSGDSGKPIITIGEVKGDKTNCYTYDSTSTNKKLYFNAGSVEANKVSTITINFTASDNSGGSGLKDEAPVTSTLGTVSESGGTYTVTISDVPAANTDVTITVTDNVGNEKAEKITLVPDNDLPTITASFTDGGTAINSSYIYGTLASGNTVYFNGNKIASPQITFSASDSGTDDTNVSVVTTPATIEISKTDTAETSITAKATDKVGNEATYTITFISDVSNDNTPKLSSLLDSGNNQITEIYPVDIAEWANNSTGYFKGSSATVLFDSDESSVDGFKGIYKWNGTELGDKLTDSKESINLSTTFTVVSVDRVGNVSPSFTITVTPDNAPPTISGASDDTYSLTSSNRTGDWYELSVRDDSKTELIDSNNLNVYTKVSYALYDTTARINLSDSELYDALSGVSSYIIKHNVNTLTETDAWTSYTAADGISLPANGTADSDTYLYLCLKDNVGNATNPIKLNFVATDDNVVPIGMYTHQETAIAYTFVDNKITFSNVPRFAGIKAIVIYDTDGGIDPVVTETVDGEEVTTQKYSGGNCWAFCNTNFEKDSSESNENKLTLVPTSHSDATTNDKQYIAFPASDTFEFSTWNITNISNIEIIDAAGNTVPVPNTIATTMFSRFMANAARSISNSASGATKVIDSVSEIFTRRKTQTLPDINLYENTKEESQVKDTISQITETKESVLKPAKKKTNSKQKTIDNNFSSSLIENLPQDFQQNLSQNTVEVDSKIVEIAEKTDEIISKIDENVKSELNNVKNDKISLAETKFIEYTLEEDVSIKPHRNIVTLMAIIFASLASLSLSLILLLKKKHKS